MYTQNVLGAFVSGALRFAEHVCR